MTKGPLLLVIVLTLISGYLGMRLYGELKVGDPPSPPSHPLVKLVEMTPEQTRQLAALDKQFAAGRDPLRAEVLRRRAHIYEELRRQDPDQAQIEADIDAMNAAQRQVQQEVVAHLLRVKGILNETQRREFFDALAVTMCPMSLTATGSDHRRARPSSGSEPVESGR